MTTSRSSIPAPRKRSPPSTMPGGAEASAAVDAAAPPSGWATPPRQAVRGAAPGLRADAERADELAETIVRENGKPIAEARGEVVTPPSSSAGSPRRPCACTAPWSRPRPAAASRSCCTSRWASPTSSRRGTSRRRCSPARSARPWPPGAPSIAKPAPQTPLTAIVIGDDPRRGRAPRASSTSGHQDSRASPR